MELMGAFVRPMLNSSVSESYTAQIFVARKLARLDASREANKILVDCMDNRATPVLRGEDYFDWVRLVEIWRSLRARYGGV
jgi:hypothetical protein